MRDYLIVNGVNLMDFGVYAFGNGIHKFPERAVEKISIPGRNGDVFVDKGKWENINIDYSMVLLDGANMDRLRAFLLSLRGYLRIESTFEPEYYRMGRFLEASEPKVQKEAATVTLTFDCKPQRWLKSGEKYITIPDGEAVTLYNPTRYTALPLIAGYVNSLYQSGTISVTNYVRCHNSWSQSFTKDVGHSVVTMQKYPTSVINIDCETKTAYTGLGDSAMDKITVAGGDFPQLMPHLYNDEYFMAADGTECYALESYTVIETEHMSNDISLIPRWWTL